MFGENAPSLLFDNANIQPFFNYQKNLFLFYRKMAKKFCFWFKR
jgi:hypothetical protein